MCLIIRKQVDCCLFFIRSMSESEKPFAIEKAKSGRAACKKCKQKLENGQLRIAKLVANYFSEYVCIFLELKNPY